MIFELIFSL